MKRNLTVQLDEEVIAKAKVVAARRGTSISGLVAAEIDRLAARDERYERARQEARARMAAPAEYASDGGWSREEMYAERTDRWA